MSIRIVRPYSWDVAVLGASETPCAFLEGQAGVLFSSSGNRRPAGIGLHAGPLPGNQDPTCRRYHGWRGTTNGASVHAYGEREVTRVAEYRDGWRVFFSRDRRPEEK
jgi:hypothetical protein